MQQKGFIKNLRLLDEDYRVDDCLDFTETINDFTNYLSNIHSHALIGVIGEYGSGKSTMLYQLEKENLKNWLVFDAWSFPDRKDLWEGFVLDFARTLTPNEFKKARKRIDGQSTEDIKSLLEVLAEGVNFFLPGAEVMKNFSTLFKSSPARRVFEFKEILKELVIKCNSDIFIVLEDADRAGKEGIIFLETVKQFISKDLKDYTDNKVIFIVPIATDNYSGNYKESYRKSLDYTYQFNPKIDFTNFIEELFIFPEEQILNSVIKSDLNEIFKFFIYNGFTIRDLKHLLRNANQFFIKISNIENFHPDIRVTILLEMHEYFGDGYTMHSLPRDVRKIQMLRASKGFFSSAFIALTEKVNIVDVLKNSESYRRQDIVFVKNHNTVLPERWYGHTEPQNWLKVSDLYLRNSTTEV